ncbi:MAG: ATP-binding protein [Candidatus Dojkabacteria bacterium]|nr:ATP-binding protein [Candidatus Dojkabacteria bacterium]
MLNVKTFFNIGKRFSSKEKLLYIYLFLSITGWVVSNAASDIIKTPEIAIFFARASILFPINILNSLLQIFRNFPRTIYKQQRYNLFSLISYLTWTFTIISLILMNSSANIQNFRVLEDNPADFSPGSLYYVVMSLAVFILVFIISFWSRNKSSYTKTQKKQISSLLATLFFVYFSMILGLLVLPLQGLSIYSPFMFLSLSLLLFIINKSLWVKVAVLDIQEEIVKLGGLVVSAIILIVIISLTDVIRLDLNLVGQFLSGFLVITTIIWINNRFQNTYAKNRRLLQAKITQFIEDSTMKLSVQELSSDLKKKLSELLQTTSVEVKIFNRKEQIIIEKKISTWWALRKRTPIINREILIESYFDKENNKEITAELFSFFQAEGIDIIIPLANQKSLIGLVYIRNSPKILNESDYKALELLYNSLSVSISRALIYKEVEDLNQSLQSKVDIQTKELKLKVKELEEARRKENDMIDIMGHELRTPATVVKLNVDFLDKFTEKIPNDRESFLKYVNRIKDAVETEIKLINTLLTSAKLAGDKVEINPEKVDVFKEIDMALHAEEAIAEEKGIKLINNIKPDTHFIFADHARVAEIFNNLISNAVRYTQKGSVTVDIKEEGKHIKVMIKDTGRGIEKSDIPKLGKKFYRTKTYIPSNNGDNFNIVRPGGTGLGLFVTFGLTRKMGGRVDVQSEVGKGSIFSVSLPKYTNQSQSKDTDSKDMFTRLNLKNVK